MILILCKEGTKWHVHYGRGEEPELAEDVRDFARQVLNLPNYCMIRVKGGKEQRWYSDYYVQFHRLNPRDFLKS